MKDFVLELEKFTNRIKNNVNFSFIRFADGEGSIIFNDIRWTNRSRPSSSWKYDESQSVFQQRLINSLEYNDENYFIGLPCKDGHHQRFHYLFDALKNKTNVSEDNLTFATIFKDYNWQTFLNCFMPEILKRDHAIVCHKNAITDIKENYRVPNSAHLYCDSIIDKMRHDVVSNQNKIYLFCAGPASNVIIHELWKINKNNTYIDIGSALDHKMFPKNLSRIYIKKNGKGYKKERWQ